VKWGINPFIIIYEKAVSILKQLFLFIKPIKKIPFSLENGIYFLRLKGCY
jgi:hypothetical protein